MTFKTRMAPSQTCALPHVQCRMYLTMFTYFSECVRKKHEQTNPIHHNDNAREFLPAKLANFASYITLPIDYLNTCAHVLIFAHFKRN